MFNIVAISIPSGQSGCYLLYCLYYCKQSEEILSNEEISLKLEKREVIGKGLNGLRRSGQLPAVIHNHGKDSVHVSGDQIEVLKAYRAAGKHHPITVDVGGKKYLTIIKQVDFGPKRHDLRHLVFGAIKQDEKVETEVPVVFEGDAPAEKAGLMIIRQLEHVQVEALPKDLIDEIKVSIEGLAEIGDKLSVADLSVPSGVTILTEAEHGIAVVEETKAQMSEEAEEAEAAEGDEDATEGGDEAAASDETQE